ncbi:MAG: hypothetical protein LBN27_01590 [Prevotellaceae bacterium]|nr:hypothetical protein [Prevotellaceae bacterium]
MKQLLSILLIAILSTSVVYGQKTGNFEKLIEETNRYLNVYDGLTPFGEYYSVKELGLTKKEIKEIVSYNNDCIPTKKDSIEAHDAIMFFQDLIIKNIGKIIEHKEFYKLNDNDLPALGIIKSKDNKLYNFKLYENSGGSYHSCFSIMFYRDNSTLINAEYSTEGDSESFFKRDGYVGIDTINTSDGTKYVLTGWVQGCNACFETSIELVQFKDGEWINDFSYSVESRSYNEVLLYDPKTKTISVEYETDDLTQSCTCEQKQEPEYDSYFDWNNRKSCECTFVFNGETFELAKQCWEIIHNKTTNEEE